MKLTHAAVVVGMSAMAATGLASSAWAAPVTPKKAPVTEQQCTNSGGHVQRAKDGVGTCVGATPDDGHLIRDVDTTGTGDTTGTTGTADDTRSPYDRDGRYTTDGRDGTDSRYGSDDRRYDDRRGSDRRSDDRDYDDRDTRPHGLL